MDDPHETAAHSHNADPNLIEAEKVKVRMRRQVTSNPAVRPSQVIAAEMLTAPDNVRGAMSSKETMRRTVRRQKRGLLPTEPASLQDLQVPDSMKCTTETSSQSFLIYDSGPAAPKRMLIFASNEQLRQLSIADRWFLDGNFAMAPKLFEQLYAIRVPLGRSSYVTCAYALMAGKTQSEYEELLRTVVDKARQLGYAPNPSVVLTDFEPAVMRAVSDVLGPTVQHQGCFYHLTQCTWRKVCTHLLIYSFQYQHR